MNEMDLSKANEAAAKALEDFGHMSIAYGGEELGPVAVKAAVPYVFEALADVLDAAADEGWRASGELPEDAHWALKLSIRSRGDFAFKMAGHLRTVADEARAAASPDPRGLPQQR